MPSCVVEIHKSPIPLRKFCKILIKDFDMPYDVITKMTHDMGIGFKSEFVDDVEVIRLTNHYYYGSSERSAHKNPSVQIVLTNAFFTNGIAEDYSDVEELFTPGSTMPLLYTKCQSEVFSKIMSLLCKVDVREIKCL